MATASLPSTDRTASAPTAPDATFPQSPAFWRALLREATTPRISAALGCLLTSVGGYLATMVVMYLTLQISVLVTIALMPLATAFLLRTFIVFHDCAHGSFFASRRANLWVGRLCATLVLVPFSSWRHEHNVHHATSGDLDKRGIGDVPTMTLAEYRDATPGARLGYRLFRNPLIMFGIGPIVAMIIGPRIVPMNGQRRFQKSVLATDAVLTVIIGLLIWTLGVGRFFLLWAPPALLAGSAGIWLFYVQHQFEDVYWKRSEEWSYADAALRGSSFLDLPRPLAWATGNIGFHHIHHLSSRVPFYNLPRTHRENAVFQSVPVLTFTEGLRCTRFKLYDEGRGRLITWPEAHEAFAATPQA
ncbi:MAG TPA: fatty acid desaturase [Solirubrobacteraceae bacterium]|nr:fatty acid desaturase [Solirubrobacteraceae bacterium]